MLAKLGDRRLGDLFALADNVFLLVLDVLFGTHADEVRVALGLDLHEELALFDDRPRRSHRRARECSAFEILGVLDDLFEDAVRDGLHVDLRIEPQAERTQEDRSRGSSLAEASVKDALLVVFKLDPRAAVRNDLCEISSRSPLKNTPGER